MTNIGDYNTAHGSDAIGLRNLKTVRWNLAAPRLYGIEPGNLAPALVDVDARLQRVRQEDADRGDLGQRAEPLLAVAQGAHRFDVAVAEDGAGLPAEARWHLHRAQVMMLR